MESSSFSFGTFQILHHEFKVEHFFLILINLPYCRFLEGFVHFKGFVKRYALMKLKVGDLLSRKEKS